MRTYTITRKAPYDVLVAPEGKQWCHKCKQLHGPNELQKLEAWHRKFLDAQVPAPTTVSVGALTLHFPAKTEALKGVSEALALAAEQTGKFTATLENPEPEPDAQPPAKKAKAEAAAEGGKKQ